MSESSHFFCFSTHKPQRSLSSPERANLLPHSSHYQKCIGVGVWGHVLETIQTITRPLVGFVWQLANARTHKGKTLD